jgi:hypothetical protein
MRAVARSLLVLIVAGVAVAAAATVSEAALAGGSRLLFYHTQQSIAHPAAGPGTATTVIGVTNNHPEDAVSVRLQVFNGQSCASAGPFTFPLAGRQTLRLLVSDLASPALFPEGWVDVWAVDAGGVPIRWDYLSGKGTLIDFGGSPTSVATYAPAALFSDRAGDQGTPIPDLTHANTRAPLLSSVEHWGHGGPNGVGTRLVVLPVSVTPGTAPSSEAPLIQFFHQAGGPAALTATNGPGCMVAAPLPALNPSFAATFPASGGVPGGGSIQAQFGEGSTNKGVVGVLFEYGSTVAGLVVTPLQSIVGPSTTSHE